MARRLVVNASAKAIERRTQNEWFEHELSKKALSRPAIMKAV